jgi:AraC-like DNA-binding protein
VLAVCGMTPSALLLRRRLEVAHGMIAARRYETVAEVAHAVGLSPAYFSRRHKQVYGQVGS